MLFSISSVTSIAFAFSDVHTDFKMPLKDLLSFKNGAVETYLTTKRNWKDLGCGTSISKFGTSAYVALRYELFKIKFELKM